MHLPETSLNNNASYSHFPSPGGQLYCLQASVKYSKRDALFLLILQYVRHRRDDCCGPPLIAPSVLRPVGMLPPRTLPHIGRADKFRTDPTAAVHFIKERSALYEEPRASAGARCLRNQTCRADEAWCNVPEPTATFT